MNQIWLRHPNGGGRKYGNECDVDPQTFLSRDSSVGDRAEVSCSNIEEGSLICDDAIVHNAHIFQSTVENTSRVLGLERARVFASNVRGDSRVRDSAFLSGVDIRNVTVFAEAALFGPWELDGFVRIHDGEWTSPPRHHRISGDGIEVTISECTEGRMHIGCQCKSYEKWTRPGYRERIGLRSGWSPLQVEETYDWFTTWRNAKVAV